MASSALEHRLPQADQLAPRGAALERAEQHGLDLAQSLPALRMASEQQSTGTEFASNSSNEILNTALSYTTLAAHKILSAHLGKDAPLVMIERNLSVPVVNLDQIPEKSDGRAAMRLIGQIVRAFTICDIETDGGRTRAHAHPLLEGEPRRLPGALYDLARSSPIVANFAASYMESLAGSNGDERMPATILRHAAAIMHALRASFSAKVPEVALSATPEPAAYSEAIGSKYLHHFQPCVFSGCYPEQVIGLSFHSQLTTSLASAIASVCNEHGLPEFKGDPWDFFASMRLFKPNDLQREVVKRFTLDGYPVSDWVRESQSSFFRNAGGFWNKIDDSLKLLAAQALERGDKQLNITIVGVGMNEEPLSVAMKIERFLDEHNLRGELDYEINVLSRSNPTMRALSAAREEQRSSPVIYPEDVLPRRGRYREEFFKPAPGGGFVPIDELLNHIRYTVSDLTDKSARPAIPAADLVLVHNVFQYIDSAENRLQALKTVEQLSRKDGKISLAGDASNFDLRSPPEVTALDTINKKRL